MAKSSTSSTPNYHTTPDELEASSESSNSSLDSSQQQDPTSSEFPSFFTAPRFPNSSIQESDFLNPPYLNSSSSTFLENVPELPSEPLRIHLLPARSPSVLSLSDAQSEISESDEFNLFQPEYSLSAVSTTEESASSRITTTHTSEEPSLDHLSTSPTEYKRSGSMSSEGSNDEERHNQPLPTPTLQQYVIEITVVETTEEVTISNQQTSSLPTPHQHTTQTSCMGIAEEGCSDCCVIL